MYNYIMKVSYDRHKSLGYLAGLASRLMSNTLGKRFQQAGIDMTAEQWGAILVLAGGDALTQGKIGEKLFLEKSSVSRLADGLERRGWIVRTRDPDDRPEQTPLVDAKRGGNGREVRGHRQGGPGRCAARHDPGGTVCLPFSTGQGHSQPGRIRRIGAVWRVG